MNKHNLSITRGIYIYGEHGSGKSKFVKIYYYVPVLIVFGIIQVTYEINRFLKVLQKIIYPIIVLFLCSINKKNQLLL